MKIEGYTIKEVYERCQDAEINIPYQTIKSAFGAAKKPGKGHIPRLKIINVTRRLRICTIESFTLWLKYHQERNDVKTGKKEASECTMIHHRTALRLRKEFIENK